jgi:hypothetical protein
MGRPHMKHPSAAVLVPFAFLWAILGVVPSAHAQEETPTGSIRLLSQTPWTNQREPELRVEVRVRNDGDDPIEVPEVGWFLGRPIDARGEYESALRDGVAEQQAADTLILDPLGPDDVAEVTLSLPTDAISAVAGTTDSSVYPLEIQFRTAGIVLDAFTTAAIHLVQPPQKQLRLSWWTAIDTPIAFRPDGTLLDAAFEEALIEGGGVVAQVEALEDLVRRERRHEGVGDPLFDLVVTPSALDQLLQAADGYRRLDGTEASAEDPAPIAAVRTLDLLRDLAASPHVRLHAAPFAAPRIPTMLGSPSTAPHLEDHWELGDEIFERVLDEPPDPTVDRPPGLAFDGESLDVLQARGMTTVLGAPDSVGRTTDPLGLAPAPAAVIETATGDPVRIVLPDPSTQTLLTDAELRRDPILLAQAVLGELATIWREEPVPPPGIRRGLALDLPADLPPAAWKALVRRLAGATFLRAVHAEDLPDVVEPAPDEATLEPRRRGAFSADYVGDLDHTAEDVMAFAAMVREPADEAERLRRWILYAESSRYLGNEPAGRMWIDAVNFVTDPAFGELAPDATRAFTFTSRTGTIPLRMGDPGHRVVDVRIVMRSQRVDFLGAGERTVRLDAPGQLVTFDAEVKAAGPGTVDVLVYSPSGLQLSRTVLVVRSTTLNPIALVITVAAGVVLVGLWSRRLFRRRTP